MGLGKRSKFFSQLFTWLGILLFAVPLVVLACLGIDFSAFSSNSSERVKPWSAEAKFFLLVFVLLLVLGAISWLVWHYVLNR
jgi:hypothetical protein